MSDVRQTFNRQNYAKKKNSSCCFCEKALKDQEDREEEEGQCRPRTTEGGRGRNERQRCGVQSGGNRKGGEMGGKEKGGREQM